MCLCGYAYDSVYKMSYDLKKKKKMNPSLNVIHTLTIPLGVEKCPVLQSE